MKARTYIALGICLLFLTGCGNNAATQVPENIIEEQRQGEIYYDMLLSMTRLERSTDVFGQTESHESTVEFIYEFDENGRVISRKSNAENFQELELQSGLDALEMKPYIEGLSTFEEQYFYDDLGRICQIDLIDNTGKITGRFSYEYDGDGNRIRNETVSVNTHFSYEYSGERLIRIVNTDTDAESISRYSGSWLSFKYVDDTHIDVFAGYGTEPDSYSTLRKQIEFDLQHNTERVEWFINYTDGGELYRIDTYRDGKIEKIEFNIFGKTVIYTYNYGDYIQ